MRRRLSWLPFAVLAAACGCSSRQLATSAQPRAEQLYTLTANWAAFVQAAPGQSPRGALDILFMVDNSTSMSALQAQLAAGFAEFMNVIDSLPGGSPDLHIGVVSSDMGAGDGSIASCNDRGGDRGALQFAPRGACTQTGLDPSAHFIALRTEPNGSRTRNYGAAALPDVFGCIALLGEAGCGFEQPLSSVRRALDPGLAPDENAGFLRRDAFLAVIMISNEDDCSAAQGVPLFDTTQNTNIGSQLGPATNFRCNEFGHVCDVNGKLQHPPRTATAELQGCQSNDGEPYLDPVSSFVAFLRGIKADPAKVFVAGVAGPPAPYRVNVRTAPVPDEAPWPEIGHSCTTPDGIFADPAVRLNQVTQSLGPYGHFETICGDSMSTPLGRIATLMTKPLAGSCVPRPSSAETCQVVDRWVDATGAKAVAVVPRCADAPRVTPCWSLTDDAGCAYTEQLLIVDRGGVPLPDSLLAAIDCTGVALPLHALE